MPDAPFPSYPARTREISDKDLETARDQFKAILDGDSEIRQRLLADHRYIDGASTDGQGNPVGQMWTSAERQERGSMPTLEIDALSGPISQVSNALADSKPAADMKPLGGGADSDKAEVWEGLLRRIQTTPEAEYAAAYAAEHIVKLGRGAWLLTAKFPEFNGKPDDPSNWEMEICRKWIENQHAVFLGPATEADGSDRMFGFLLQPYSKELFNEQFAEGDVDEFEVNRTAWDALGSDEQRNVTGWQKTNTITVASWYRVKSRPVTLTGTDSTGQPRNRTVKQRYVCHSIITATKEYAYEELPIAYIPIVMGEAKRSNIDGARDVRGMVRRGRQPQDMVNVWNCYIAATIAQAARQEVIAAAGQISGGMEGFWDLTKRLPWREYQPLDVNGKLAPPPQIVSAEPPIQAMSLALQQAESNVLKATLHYDSASDETNAERSKESGRARMMRQRQGELGSSDFARVYRFMILYEIKILMAWIPTVYDSARVMRITGRDEEEFSAVTHFGPQFAGAANQLAAQMPQGDDGVKGVYDLSTGRYDVKADVQKNPLTQRQENVDVLTELIPSLSPEMQAKVAPIMLGEMEGSIMRKVAAALNPKEGTVSIEDAKKAQQMIDALTQKLDEQQRTIDNKSTENASKEKIALAEMQSKEAIEQAKIALERERMLHDEKMKEYELQQQQAQAEFDAQQAQLQREHDRDEGDHAAAREFALREPEPAKGADA
jgi:portal protein